MKYLEEDEFMKSLKICPEGGEFDTLIEWFFSKISTRND